MTSCEKQDLLAAIVYSQPDLSTANSLIGELEHRDIQVIGVGVESALDVSVALRSCRKCVVYMSPQLVLLSDPCRSAVFGFADDRGRSAVVVVLDETLQTPPDEWAHFLCFRHAGRRLNVLCRALAVLIRTPQLSSRRQTITGYATAFRELNGYLRLVLPNFSERLEQLYHYASCVKKLLIVCPESCYCPPTMEVDDSIEHADVYVLRNVTRAGQKHRDFTVCVYRIRDRQRSCTYYFPAICCNSLASFRDIRLSGLAGVDDTRMRVERNRFVLHLKQLLQHSKDARYFTKQYRILYWRDKDCRLENFLLPIVREELVNEPAEVSDLRLDFKYVDGGGVNPGSLYVNLEECYKLNSEPMKGICLIINIAEFTGADGDACGTITPRYGSEVDVRHLTDVFRWLKFDVQYHENATKSRFLSIVNEAGKLDHSKYDAFVCCVMSHGYLGNVLAADCQSVRILEDIARPFYPESCPTLAGKPKMFFIQSCLTSDAQVSDDDVAFSASGNTTSNTVDATADFATNNRTVLLPEDVADFFMSYSTLPRRPSYRDGEGSLYVQALTEVLKKGLEIQDSLDQVAQRVEQKIASKHMKDQQRPFYYVSREHKAVFLCGKLLLSDPLKSTVINFKFLTNRVG